MLRSATSIYLLLGATMIASTSTTGQRAGSASTGTAATASAPSAASIAEFWIDPGTTPRNLFDGPPGVPAKDRPTTDGRFDVVSKDTAGFSATYKVHDAAGRKWSVKIGPEAQTEVVASRIVWAVGYHEVPSYFVERWIAVEKAKGAQLGGARFRPDDAGLKSKGIWSWQKNPFVGTAPYNGLLVLMMIINSTDLKDDNNTLYEVEGPPLEDARQWYVVKDLGASLGESGRMDPRRGYIDGFEKEPFITGVKEGRVLFGFRGRHQELLERIRVEDVRWMCERLQKVTDRQWHDAFRAGNYTEEITARYVARIRQKMKEGLELR
jgi:hypothetical protein